MKFNDISDRFPWVWAAAGALLFWAVLMVTIGSFSFAPLVAAMTSGAFLLLIALGQSLAMMTGAGNVDLSMPSVITLSAYVSLWVVGGQEGMGWSGVFTGIALGAAIGMLNGLAVVFLRIPAIIATLAMGYIVTTFCLMANEGISTNTVAPGLRFFATGQLLGVPVVVLLAAAMTLVAGLFYTRTGAGRMLLATGQNHEAARMAGIRVWLVVVLAFAICGGLAGLTGVLLGARSGGAFLDMGEPYLLLSVGAVVIGGTPLFGGRVTVIGCAMGALFLVFLSTLMPVIGFTGGEAEILQGSLIIAVLVIGGLRLRHQMAAAD